MTDTPAFLPYGRQTIEEDDISAVAEVLRGDFLTTGPAVEGFEHTLAHRLNAGNAVVCSNGTTALYMAAEVLRLGPGTKVIVPAITFLATANAPHLCGADIIFADVDPDTGLMRPADLVEALNHAGHANALFNVHLAGQCGDVEEICAIARAHGMHIVHDACHAIGGTCVGRDGKTYVIGSNGFSDMTVFSFHPVKTITMGEGGAITTNDPSMANALRLARSHGMTRNPADFVHPEAGLDASGNANPWYYEMQAPQFNFRVTDIQCALGLSQLGKLERFAKRRAELANLYDEFLAPLAPAIRPTTKTMNCHPVLHLYQVLIDFAGLKITRAEAMHKLHDRGIGTQVHYIPVNMQPYYTARYGRHPLSGAEAFYERTLSLPFYPSLTDGDVERVCSALKDVLFQ